ncbi:acyl-CoA thioesterase II [Aquabacterium sp. J223]|uniref:acyl-CoA thioesterase II n=1 Tax=Aquabacterium sp. J223 TaxID=2898431 RepID=UPI0021ADB3C4|nr:acyl-CoA thioesterase II [Aquabacterium sp. J223]UUX97572.1 acyl-CoA thioesterase II [Aquabacterium sp. J223]
MQMSPQDLIALLRVEPLEHNLFRGQSADIGSPQVFGGQVLGQALMAAGRTVPGDRSVHSLHAYFLLPGDKRAPIVYEVERIRDGGSFTTRRVVAIQHGQRIFNFAASFHTPEPGVEHADAMPEVPPPESLRSEDDLRREFAPRAPAALRRFFEPTALEIRPVQTFHPLQPTPMPPRFESWMRCREPLPDEPLLHQALLAYASDWGLLRTAMLPHGLSFMDKGLRVASLDHAMWFHGDFRLDDWLLYATESPRAGGARGFCRGQAFTRDGRLVASMAQEGLVRRVPPPAAA